jgi:hypothetical protein
MNCPCICCAEAHERMRTDRDVSKACNCLDYGLDERCDCPLCVALMSGALTAPNHPAS